MTIVQILGSRSSTSHISQPFDVFLLEYAKKQQFLLL